MVVLPYPDVVYGAWSGRLDRLGDLLGFVSEEGGGERK